MLLFDSLHMASTSMNASQLGIQVAGQNLSNSQTAGYVREQLVLESGGSRNFGGVTIGTGVEAVGVRQVIDRFLEERLRTSTSDAVSSATQQKYYTELEALLNETTDNDLSTALSDFFNSIDNILDHPEDVNYREMTVTQGEKLAGDINRLSTSLTEMQLAINQAITQSADEINRLLKEIEELNTSISLIETGTAKEALGLRDQRYDDLMELSKLINIKTVENADTGKVSIYCGSDLLLSDGRRNEVYVGMRKENEESVSQSILCIRDTKTPLDVRSGGVYGLYEAHTTILGDYAKQLDDFSVTLIEEFNKLYASGQGLTGYTQLTSSAQVNNPDEPLAEAQLDHSIRSGVFSVQVFKDGVLIKDQEILVTVNEPAQSDPFSLKPTPEGEGTSLEDIAAAINEIEGLIASVDSHGRLEIKTDNPNIEFSFAGDSSGVLSALGVNTFFTGNSAATIGVHQTVQDDPGKFAASLGGVGHDTDNGVLLAEMSVAKNDALGGKTITGYYDSIVSQTMLAAGTTKSVAASDALYRQSLQTQRDSVSGVNIDEETILMMTYQRMYQANSKYISMINEILETLINL